MDWTYIYKCDVFYYACYEMLLLLQPHSSKNIIAYECICIRITLLTHYRLRDYVYT